MKRKSFKILVLILVALHIYLIFMRWIYWMLDYHYGDFDYIFLKLVDVPNGFEVVDNLYNEVLFDIYYLAFSTIVTIIIAVKYLKQQKKKMKKIIIYISIMVSNCASLGAQSRELTATANLSKDGDSIHYDFITATVPQSSSASDQTWDFSNSRYLGQEKEVFFVGNDSNHIKMIDKDAILDFSQDKEHLLLKRLQTPLLNIDFGNSFEYLKFPFPLNDSLTCQIEGKGTYCSKNKLVLSGTCCTKTMAKGKYQFEGGYCSFDNNLNPTYHYYEKDHLGSIRMVVNENGTIEQVNHYYPFGGVYGDLAYNSELQKNKYIGKEFDHTSGLDWYDHGARMYDAAKGSWDRMDKLAEKYKATTPYAYSINNPSKFADIDGLDIVYMLQGGIEQKRIISKQNITYVQNLANQGKESFSKEDSLFLQTFIIHKTNMPTKLLFDRQIYKIAKNTNNENFLNKRNTKINISERIINNQKVYIYELRYKKIPPLEQECIYILFFPNTHECYIFYFQKLLIKENNIWLWFNLRGNLSVTRINLEELKTIIL